MNERPPPELWFIPAAECRKAAVRESKGEAKAYARCIGADTSDVVGPYVLADQKDR